MTKGNEHKNDSENSSGQRDDDANNRNRTLSRIRTRSARGSSSEDNVSNDRTSKRRSGIASTPSEGIVTRRGKRISNERQVPVKGDDDSDKQGLKKDTKDVSLDDSSSSPQQKDTSKQSKDPQTDSASCSSSNEAKTKLIESFKGLKREAKEEEERQLKWEADGSSEDDDDDDTKPLSALVNRDADNDESNEVSVSKEESDPVTENENVTEISENEKQKDDDAEEEEEEEDDESGRKEAVNVVDERSQSGLPNEDGDSCDSIDRKVKNDSDSCSASVTSGDGSRAKGRNKGEHRPKIDFRIGAKIEARDCMNMWYPSKIIQVDWDDKEVLIHFERWNSRFDEWVSMDSPRLRAVTRTSSRKDKMDHSFRVFKGYRVGEVVLAKWADCKMYPAKILKILPDFSYSVVFYDGFERTVQSINVKKLPPEMIGQVNFKNVPPSSHSSPIPEKRVRLPTSKSFEMGKLKAYARRTSSERSESRVPSKTKATLPSTTNSSKGNATGVSPPKKTSTKLLVGGIFQAKRHKLAVKIGKNFGSRKSDKRSSKKKSSKSSKSSHDSKSKKKATHSSLVTDGVSLGSTSEGNSTLDVPRKQFVIEEDHNHFKCPMGDCGKAFRKESLLSSHIKHYHREVTRPTPTVLSKSRKRSASGALKDAKQPVKVPGIENQTLDIVTELVIAEQLQQHDHQQHASKLEGNMDRKMITEKRRQLLLQKKLETVYKKRQQQALMEKNRLEMLEKSRQARKARLSESLSQPEKPVHVEKDEVEVVSKKPDEMEVTLNVTGGSKKKRRKKSFHKSFISERRNRKKKILESSSKSRLPDAKVGNWNGKGSVVGNVLNSSELQHDKRKLHQVLFASDDDSTTTLCSDNDALPEDKTVLEELTKEFKQFTRNRMAVRTFKEWGESGRQEVVNCRCELQEEEGLMMQCEVCLSWQHGMCFNIEDEDKVPEKYICFACENPRGLRHNFRYRHHQDWFKRGEMATFKFLPKRDNWKLREDMLRTHNLSSQMVAINEVLRSLRHKMHLVKDGDKSSLKLWSTPWVSTCGEVFDGDNQSQMDETLQNDTLVEDAMLHDRENESWSFTDHSYSNADRSPQEESVPATPPMDDICPEPEIEGIQITVSTSSPQHDESYETEVTIKPDPDESSPPISASDIVPKKEPNEISAGEQISTTPQSNDDQNTLMPKLEEIKEAPIEATSNDLNCLTPKLNEINSLPTEETKFPPKLVPIVSKEVVTLDPRKDAGKIKKERKGKPLRNNLKLKKNVITKEFSVYDCQLNLLDHIQQLQEELDKRMDELSEQLDVLESNYEPATTFNDNAEDRLIDMPRVKRLLKGMTVDLNKVRRMSLYC